MKLKDIQSIARAIVTGVVFCSAVGVTLWGLQWRSEAVQLRQEVQTNYIPTPTTLQRRLKDEGYYSGEIDGLIGTESTKAWDKFLCQQYADRCNYYYEEQ